MRVGYLRGALSPPATQRQMDVLAAYVAAFGCCSGRCRARGHPAEHREAPPRRPCALAGLTTEQLIYRGRAEGWLVVSSLEPR